MLFKYAVKRGYLPKDHDELSGVERADDSGTDIEVFTPAELRKLLDMVRPEMVPYLAIAAFAGLRAAEIDRLDWSEVNLAERFIELKASKAKTASRRLAPIPDNLLAWLTPYAQPFGPVCNFERSDKQLFYYLAPKAGLKWKRNGLRHSFISYRLAVVKDVGAVSLEAGNSAQMIFKHYRQLVTEKQGNEWFSIKPGESAANVIPLPAAAA
jgi:integrase